MRALLRPGWVVTHLLVIAIAVTFVSLGLWQLRRHAEVGERNEAIRAQLADDPAPAVDLLASGQDPDFRAATATGRYLEDADVRLSPRSRNDSPGYEVLTPLVLGDGSALIVNRGWMPLDTAPVPPPAGEVTVDGRLRATADARQALRDDAGKVTLVSAVDPDVLATQVPGLVAAAYLERIDDAALAARDLPLPALPVELDGGPHLLYAGQWFAFTAIGLVGYPLLLRRRLLDADDPDRAARPVASSSLSAS